MKKVIMVTLTCILTLSAALLYSCSSGGAVAVGGSENGGNPPVDTPPAVISTIPQNGATGVALGATVSATFSETIDPATITNSSFTVSSGVTGTISYNASSHVVTFTPLSALTANTTYTVTITAAVTDLAGNPMAADYVWSFTTGAGASGALDVGFGVGGIVTMPVGTHGDGFFALVLQSDGKLVAAGSAEVDGLYRFVVARYNTDGSLDANFGSGGKVVTPAGDECSYIRRGNSGGQ